MSEEISYHNQSLWQYVDKQISTASLTIDKFVSKDIMFFYINKEEGLCINKIMANNFTNETGGKFYSYTEGVGHVADIINELGDKIIDNTLRESESTFLEIVMYNTTKTFIYEIYDLPGALEQREYVIPDNNLLSEYITNITRVEIYLVKKTKEGEKVRSGMLSYWEYK